MKWQRNKWIYEQSCWTCCLNIYLTRAQAYKIHTIIHNLELDFISSSLRRIAPSFSCNSWINLLRNIVVFLAFLKFFRQNNFLSLLYLFFLNVFHRVSIFMFFSERIDFYYCSSSTLVFWTVKVVSSKFLTFFLCHI